MKIADLYIRVSTDEQADKGYSQRDQEERLRRYCVYHSIEIRNVIFEDHSAKTFNRPEWKKLILNLKKYKNRIDIVLFTKWDRFSRNTGDSYMMISILRKLGVEPQAIEQPLDMSIPESKLMLAFYLAQPEVDNDRRALNVFYGMRRARKEGRYMGLAPIGYQNKSHEDGRKYIAPKEPEASIIRWAYEELARGIFNTEQVLLQARQKGFTGAKSLFWVAMRNPVYCGKIFIPQFKDEESHFVKATHEAIISENLYYIVQDVLDGRKREQYAPKIIGDDKLPLRGFLICPKCGKLLTGSTSKGRHKYYSYYHCFGNCAHRFRAEPVNQLLLDELDQYIPQAEIKKLYAILIAETYYEQTKEIQLEKKQVLAQIKEYEQRLTNARDLIASRKIDEDDFRPMKSGYLEQINRLEKKLNTILNDTDDIEGLLNEGIERLLKLDEGCKKGDLGDMRGLIGRIYPDNLTYDGYKLRTGRVNEIVESIYLINKELGVNKKGQIRSHSDLSCKVGMAGFEPAASTSQMWRDTGLRYIPKGNAKVEF